MVSWDPPKSSLPQPVRELGRVKMFIHWMTWGAEMTKSKAAVLCAFSSVGPGGLGVQNVGASLLSGQWSVAVIARMCSLRSVSHCDLQEVT